MTSPARLGLFEGYGVELEYMIVDRETLNIVPVGRGCDRLIHDVVGRYDAEIEMGELCWSNELVLHVVELKTNGPVRSLKGLHRLFQQHVTEVNQRLAQFDAQLMPTAMHPWMDPHREMQLWPHEHSPVYEQFNRIFDCRGHGWANLQSTHLNLPFNGDEEFARLHAAIRLVLPILPGLAASSPIVDAAVGEFRDSRLEVYRHNARRVPLVSGRVIPEPVFSHAEYVAKIFQPLYAAIAPHDPQGILQDEWLNARGAIARFDRGAIEIRVLDIQECPLADLAVLSAVVALIRSLVKEQHVGLAAQQRWSIDPLERILLQAIRHGEDAVIDNAEYLALFGMTTASSATVRELWQHLIETVVASDPAVDDEALSAVRTIVERGTLSSRILRAFGERADRSSLHRVYAELCQCLRDGRLFGE
jgi:glutamate---cysteine ligase / carboxylate-amine ligase